MSNVYFMCWKDRPKDKTFSVFSKQKIGLPHELDARLEGKSTFISDCYFKEISLGKDGLIYSEPKPEDDVWQDYPPNEFAIPMMSENFMRIVKDNSSEVDAIDFIDVNIEHFGISKKYYILRFNKQNNIINIENTTYVKETDIIIKPCFESKAFDTIKIATLPAGPNLWKINSSIYVSEKLKKIIEKHKIKGLEFSKAKVV